MKYQRERDSKVNTHLLQGKGRLARVVSLLLFDVNNEINIKVSINFKRL